MTPPPTVQFASFAYGDGPELDDPAEACHEAAKLYPTFAQRQLPALDSLGPALLASTRRASRRHPHRPRTRLPRTRPPRARLGRVLAARRSRAPGAGSTLALADVARLAAPYVWAGDPPRRQVPSGGALYPLELYVVAGRVQGLAPGVYHLDPVDAALELLGPGAPLAEALVEPALADSAAATLVVTGVFRRTRCKYGVRGYRFVLLEAGHLVQTILLVATASGIDALPLGGFYDARLDAIVGADGVDESVLYAVAVGRSP